MLNVYLFDGTTRLTESSTPTSGKISFNNPNGVVVIPAGTSKVITVVSDIATGTSGQLVGVSLTGITANVDVKSSLPIVGGTQTIASAQLSSIAVGSPEPSGTPTINAGVTNYTLFSSVLTITNREANLQSVSFQVIGSIPTDALENLQLYISGVPVGSPISLDSNGVARFNLSSPVKISSGDTLEVRGNVVKGSNRSFNLSLQNNADLVAVDSVYNVNATVTGAPKTTGTITIAAGTVSVTQDPTFNNLDIVGGATEVTVAKYNFKAFGEDVRISYLDVLPSINIDNVLIYVNGMPVTSKQSYTGTALTFALGSSLVVPANSTVSVEIKADTKAGGTDITTGNITMTLKRRPGNAIGLSSQSSIDAPSGDVSGQTLSVGRGTLVIAKSADTKTAISPNTANQKIGSFVVQAGHVEGARISNVKIDLTVTTMALSNLSDLYIKYNGVQSTPVMPQASNNFTVDLQLAANETATIDVYASTGGAITGDVTATLALTARGLSTNTALTTTPANVAGNAMILTAITLANPTKASTSPVAQFLLSGQEVFVADYNFVSTGGTSIIDRMEFEIKEGNSTLSSVIIDGKPFPVINNKIIATGLNISIPAGYAGKNVQVKAVTSPVGMGGISSNLPSTLRLTGFRYTGGNIVSTVTGRAIDANEMRIVGGMPSVDVVSETGALTGNGDYRVLKVKVTANGGPVKLQELPVKITSTGSATITDVENNIKVKVNDSDITTTNAPFGVAAGGSGTVNIKFDGDGYDIGEGQIIEFHIYAPITGVTTTATSIRAELGAKSSLKWTDVSGNCPNITGANVYSSNYSVIEKK